MVYRRYGNGQTLSLGVGNLWRWVFNPKAKYDNNAYDRFWDQLTLWLLANGGVTPLEGYSLRADTSNLPLGETIHLRFGVHGIEPPATPPVVALFKDDVPVTSLTFTKGDPNRVSRRVHAARNGTLSSAGGPPGGKAMETHFMVFRDDVENIETAMDRSYLEQLAKASGGRMIDAAEIGELVDELLRDSAEQAPLIRRITLWDRAWIFWLLCFLLAGMVCSPSLGLHLRNIMNPQETSHATVLDVLHRAGALHSRQRAILFLLRSALWLVAAIPLLLLADVLFHFSEPPRLAGVIGVDRRLRGRSRCLFSWRFLVHPPLLRIGTPAGIAETRSSVPNW